MPRRATPLTAAKVAKAAPGEHVDGNGLRLLVRATGARFWIFRFTLAGRTREMGLGRAGTEPGSVPLSEARQTAGDLYRLVRAGTDPLAKRDAEAAAARAREQQAAVEAITFRTVAGQCMDARDAGLRNVKHRAQWRSTLETYAFPVMGDLPVASVAPAHVLAVLEPIWTSKTETASRVRGRIEAVLDFAKARGWRSGENPAQWKGHLDQMLATPGKVSRVEHHASLPWTEIGGFMDVLRAQPGMAALALQFTILTAARTGEIIGARWSEIDLQAALWTIPAARMKAHAEHRVPLSRAALDVLATMAKLRRTDDPAAFVFPSSTPGRGLSNMAMEGLLRRMGRKPDVTVHGFRSSFRVWVAEHTHYQRDIAEAALAHTVGDKTEAAYQRGDLLAKRRDMMAAWSGFCAVPYARPEGNVVAIHAA